MDEGSLPAHPQGWCSRYRRCDGGRVRAKPGGQAFGPLGALFLHHVLDEWFENEVKPRLKGKSTLVRFADDAVMAFADFLDTTRVLGVLGKRFGRYELKLHPDKTRFVDFRCSEASCHSSG